MPVNYFVNVRQQLKVQFLEYLKANPDVPIKQALALFSLKSGLKVTTLQIYYQELKDANLIVDDNA